MEEILALMELRLHLFLLFKKRIVLITIINWEQYIIEYGMPSMKRIIERTIATMRTAHVAKIVTPMCSFHERTDFGSRIGVIGWTR